MRRPCVAHHVGIDAGIDAGRTGPFPIVDDTRSFAGKLVITRHYPVSTPNARPSASSRIVRLDAHLARESTCADLAGPAVSACASRSLLFYSTEVPTGRPRRNQVVTRATTTADMWPRTYRADITRRPRVVISLSRAVPAQCVRAWPVRSAPGPSRCDPSRWPLANWWRRRRFRLDRATAAGANVPAPSAQHHTD